MERVAPNIEIRLFRRDQVPGQGIAVVIDVYLATSNLILLTQKGASSLLVVNEESLDLAKARYPKSLIVGESLLPIKFDISNSSSEIEGAQIEGKDVLYMTINGTKALESVDYQGCEKVLVASFLNLSATAEYLRKYFPEKEISLFAAGDQGKYVLEDKLCAQILADRFLKRPFVWSKLRVKAKRFIEKWYGGWEKDIEFALALDSSPMVLQSLVFDNLLKVVKIPRGFGDGSIQ